MEAFEQQRTTAVSQAFPERGLRAYSVVAGSWLALFPASGLLRSTGIFQAWLSEHELKDYSDSQVGWIFSIYAFLFFFGGLLISPLFDKYGLKVLLPFGAVGLATAMLLTSFCVSYYQFILSFSILGGISGSILWTLTITTLGHWFQSKRGMATGLATTAGSVGGVLYTFLFTQLSSRLGFAWTMRCISLMSAVCLAGALALMRTRLPRNPQARLRLNWTGFKDMRFVLTIAAIFLLDLAVLVPPAYMTTYTSTAAGHRQVAQYVLLVINLASAFGQWLPGVVADKVGRFNVMIVCAAACTATIFGLWLQGANTATIMAFSVLYGFFSGPAYSLTPVCVAQLCEPEDYPTQYGTAYGIVSLATLVGIPISGSILKGSTRSDFSPLIIFCGAVFAASTGLFVVARGVSQGWRVQTKF